MRKTLLFATAGLLAVSNVAFAAFGDADADADGAISPDEFATAFPDATAETFTLVDVNADGMITEDEHVAAVDSGLLPAE